jgi:hypothetical protein
MKRQGKRATQPAAVAARAEAAFGAVEPAASLGRDSFTEGARPRFSMRRKLSATDGPFAETKEGLGGIHPRRWSGRGRRHRRGLVDSAGLARAGEGVT